MPKLLCAEEIDDSDLNERKSTQIYSVRHQKECSGHYDLHGTDAIDKPAFSRNHVVQVGGFHTGCCEFLSHDHDSYCVADNPSDRTSV